MEDKITTATKVKDPVCGKEVDSATAMYMSSYKGQTYYFDSESCKHQFDEDPEMYVK